jgi:hypothetical protein
MMKLLFGFLLFLSILLFSYIQWGVMLTGAAKNGTLLGDLNSEKIKLLAMPPAKTSAVLPVTVEQSAVAAAAPLNLAPATSAVPASAPLAKPLAPVPLTTLHVPAPKTVALACAEWGEFSGPYLERAKKELDTMQLGGRLAQRTVEYKTGYRVYIPPLANNTAIRKKIDEIKASGLEEYYVLKHQGAFSNAISLGIFKSEESARQFLAFVRKKGFRTAKIGERKQILKFIVFEFKGLDAENFTHLTKLQKDFVNSELKKINCSK